MTSLVNKYFKRGHHQRNEQHLIDRLIQESIQIQGRTYYYCPRNMMIEDLVLGEDVLSKFSLAVPIEMYMMDATGFTGDKEMFSKFGLEIRNSYKLVVSKARWEKEVKSQYDNNTAGFTPVTSLRPQEGDLIYDPLTTFLFETKFVDHDVEFFQLGRNYQYYLSCEAFIYQNEIMATGIDHIDAFNVESKDILEDQLMTEASEMLTQEFCGYILYDTTTPNSVVVDGETVTPRGGGDTNFIDPGLNIKFTPTNPFGGL